MQLAFDADVEAFRAEFVAFLDEHLPDEAETVQRSRSSSDIPAWARRWQRLLFDHGLAAALATRLSSAAATPRCCSVRNTCTPRSCRWRRIYPSFNPQGVGIIAASILSFGTAEQKQNWRFRSCATRRG